MGYRRYLVLTLLLPIACKQQAKDEPLLLEDAPVLNGPRSASGPAIDNGRCHVCHINYAEEKLAVAHAQAGIGCERCHGPSDPHCSDEDNITPPDTMYPAAKINPSCMPCHTQQKIDTPDHKPVLGRLAANEKFCTDCHGEHRLAYRTRRWDKVTGKLVSDDKVRMTNK